MIEAREAVKQASETLNQGQSIMVFTVFTIIFVSPLLPNFMIEQWLTMIGSFPSPSSPPSSA